VHQRPQPSHGGPLSPQHRRLRSGCRP
jgi:hypothetical protein